MLAETRPRASQLERGDGQKKSEWMGPIKGKVAERRPGALRGAAFKRRRAFGWRRPRPGAFEVTVGSCRSGQMIDIVSELRSVENVPSQRLTVGDSHCSPLTNEVRKIIDPH